MALELVNEGKHDEKKQIQMKVINLAIYLVQLSIILWRMLNGCESKPFNKKKNRVCE